MTIPFTPAQIPQNSILDIYGKQTYLGNAFVLPQNGKTLADTAEHPAILLRNPAGSGKSLFIFARKIASTAADLVYVRYYAAPTPNVVGALTTPLNLRSGAGTASIATSYLASTITGNGTLMMTLLANPATSTVNELQILDPGNDLLITAQALTGTPTVLIENYWYEI